jgi:hypothetical protein
MAAMAVRVVRVALGLLLWAVAAVAQCEPVPDPALAGHVYDLSGLLLSTADYTAAYTGDDGTAVYTLQFCSKSLAAPPAPACAAQGVMACEDRGSGAVADLGRWPTDLRVLEPGQLQLAYSNGACVCVCVCVCVCECVCECVCVCVCV